MAGTINSLGIGSGVLTSDVIEKLKANEESTLITPITNKLTTAQLKQKSFDLLNSLMGTFQTGVSKLSDSALFLNRSVSGNTDAVKVTAEAGSDVQSFSLSDIITAKADVNASKALSSTTTPLAPLATPGSQLTLSIGSNSFTIDYSSATTLEGLKNAINEKAGEKVTASILQVGTSSYQLMLKSDGVGADQAITLTDSLNDGTNDANSLLTALNMTNLQHAGDASFKYNGISITRPTNDISDLINGVAISLKQDQTAGTQANISITQNKEQISTEMSLFVQNYNTLMTNISDMTAYDKAAGKVGVFNGENFIKSIKTELNRIITSADINGTSLIDYGISIDRNGVMSFDSAAFSTKFSEDPVSLEQFFSGKTVDGTEQNGLFDTLYDQMKNYTGYQKQLSTFKANLDASVTKLSLDKETMQERIDARFEILSKRFAAYDGMISKLNNQFSALKSMIDAELNAKNN